MQKRQNLIITLTALLTGLTLVGSVGMYFVLRSVESPQTLSQSPESREIKSSSIPDVTIAPVETSAPGTGESKTELSEKSPQPFSANPNQNNNPISQNISQNKSEVGRTNKNFGGVNWKNRDLRRQNLREAQFGGANLVNTNLSGVDLSRANFGGANLKGANLRGANLNGTDLRGANLEGADLRETNLDAAFVDGANLQNAKLP